jgi:predicted phosphatase
VVIRRGLEVAGGPVLRRVKSSSLLRSRSEAVSLWDLARRLSLWAKKSSICSKISSITVAGRALVVLAITASRP